MNRKEDEDLSTKLGASPLNAEKAPVRRIGRGWAVLVSLLAFAPVGSAGADTLATQDGTSDSGTIDLSGADGLDSGGSDWGRYEVSASAPVSPLVRLGAHHASRWSSDPDHPEVEFQISEYAYDWDIAETGLEIKAAYVPGYYIRARVCARTSGNIGGTDGAIDTLEITGASSSPEVQLASFDPSATGTCTTVTVYNPVEAGADEYTLMVRPELQIAQSFWQYTIYGTVVVQYYPILG